MRHTRKGKQVRQKWDSCRCRERQANRCRERHTDSCTESDTDRERRHRQVEKVIQRGTSPTSATAPLTLLLYSSLIDFHASHKALSVGEEERAERAAGERSGTRRGCAGTASHQRATLRASGDKSLSPTWARTHWTRVRHYRKRATWENTTTHKHKK